MNIDKLILEAKKRGKKVNPWAVCTASIGGKIGSTERSDWSKTQTAKYEKCVKDVKKKQGIKEEFISERILIKSILKEYTNNKVVLTEQELNEALLNEGLKDILLGIAFLTGIGLNQSQAQTANQALSKEETKKQIEMTLQDTTQLNKITKNLPSNVKDKIFQNADKALENLESKKGKVISTVTAKGEKQLASKLKQGYALTGAEMKSDTIAGKDTIITYTQPLNFTIGSDGLFKTASYELSNEGINIIKNIRDSINQVGGQIESVIIEAGTDREPIKMGNKQLAQLRAESVAKYFTDVDSVSINTDSADAGPDFSALVKEKGREEARKETAEYRFVKITINATYQDTINDRVVKPEQVINNNTYTLVKTIKEKSSGSRGFKINWPKSKKPKYQKTKCNLGKGAKCPDFNKKIERFLDFGNQ